jgi:tyrosyl-tRNA synthetase
LVPKGAKSGYLIEAKFLIRTTDTDVERYLYLFTLLPTESIQHVMKQHETDASKRSAQHLLAKELVSLVHGEKAAQEAENAHKAIFQDGQRQQYTRTDHNSSLEDHLGDPASSYDSKSIISLSRSQVINAPLPKILHLAGLVESRNAGLRLVQGGGVYVAYRGGVKGEKQILWAKITEAFTTTGKSFIVDQRYIVVRLGKWNVKTISLFGDSSNHDERQDEALHTQLCSKHT